MLAVQPVTESGQIYATVLGTEPVRETMTSTSPREVCEDVVVQERLPERDGNVGGTVAGALIGGLVGNQIGGGNGRKVATVAGAATGGYVGNRIDRNHVGGRVVERVDRQCRTVQDSSQSSRVVAYNVTYRNPDGTTGSMRTDSNLAQMAMIRAAGGIGMCQNTLARRDPDLVPVLAEAIALSLETYVVMHENLKTAARCRVTFDALVAGLLDYVSR